MRGLGKKGSLPLRCQRWLIWLLLLPQIFPQSLPGCFFRGIGVSDEILPHGSSLGRQQRADHRLLQFSDLVQFKELYRYVETLHTCTFSIQFPNPLFDALTGGDLLV